jgi:predicted Holliday junction resolvase-like endonuclease
MALPALASNPATLRLLAAALVILLLCIFCIVLGLKLGLKQGRRLEAADWKAHKLEDVVASRVKQSRAVINGQVAEQIAPLLPGFPFAPGDCRFIGKPIDFLVFRGMEAKNISEVVFLEIKTGKAGGRPAGLNEQEKRLRDCIKAGRVRWEELDI